ncbi:hypothetical protein AOLI_G00321960 [Acnodon oligacanthus]
MWAGSTLTAVVSHIRGSKRPPPTFGVLQNPFDIIHDSRPEGVHNTDRLLPALSSGSCSYSGNKINSLLQPYCPQLAWRYGLNRASLTQALSLSYVLPPEPSARHALLLFLSINGQNRTAKLAVWKTRKNKATRVGCVNPELMGRIRVEYEYYRLVHQVEVFGDVWGQSAVLCCVDGDSHLVFKF